MAVVLSICPGAHGKDSFSELQGFKDYYARYPPGAAPPDEGERRLLEKYRPRFYLAEGAEPFIDFYRDYVAYGDLEDGSGNRVSKAVSRELLNRFKDDPRALFEHTPHSAKTRPVAYGRVDYDVMEVPGGENRSLTFLTYNIVFRKSGLPRRIRLWQKALLAIVASLEDWHQLDHYISATIALDDRGRPLAVTLQQHNYQTTYILGRDLPLPRDGRIEVDVAISSNELYPHDPGRREHRAVSFLTSDSAYYLVTGKNRPALAGMDVTHGAVEVEYELEFLPPSDAFYTFKGRLGKRRLIPHRSGPPGADFNTLPSLKPKAAALAAFYRRGDDDLEFVELLRKWEGSLHAGPGAEVSRRYAERFLEDLRSSQDSPPVAPPGAGR